MFNKNYTNKTSRLVLKGGALCVAQLLPCIAGGRHFALRRLAVANAVPADLGVDRPGTED